MVLLPLMRRSLAIYSDLCILSITILLKLKVLFIRNGNRIARIIFYFTCGSLKWLFIDLSPNITPDQKNHYNNNYFGKTVLT